MPPQPEAAPGRRLTEVFRRAFVKFRGPTDLAGAAIASPGRSCEAVSDAEGLWKRPKHCSLRKKRGAVMFYSVPTQTRGVWGRSREVPVAAGRRGADHSGVFRRRIGSGNGLRALRQQALHGARTRPIPGAARASRRQGVRSNDGCEPGPRRVDSASAAATRTSHCRLSAMV